MRRETFAGWIFAAATALACAVLAMMWPSLEPALGYWLLAACASLAIAAIVLLFWPQRGDSGGMGKKKKEQSKLVALGIEEGSSVNGLTVAGNRAIGFDSVEWVRNRGKLSDAKIHDNEAIGPAHRMHRPAPAQPETGLKPKVRKLLGWSGAYERAPFWSRRSDDKSQAADSLPHIAKSDED